MVFDFTENQVFLANSSIFLVKEKSLLTDKVRSIIKRSAEIWQIIETKYTHDYYE